MAPLADITMMSTEEGVNPEARLFGYPTNKEYPWQAIVIHDSGSFVGDAETLNQYHASLGFGGLAHHFVINNGSVEQDGQIQVGYRWRLQESRGYYLDMGEGGGNATKDQIAQAHAFHRNAIAICLIGDADEKPFTSAQNRELVMLVRQLQKRFGISTEHIVVHVGSGEAGVTPLFSEVQFRQQLVREHD